MPLVGAALGDDVHHAAGVLAVLRSVVVGLNAEFLNGVRHGERHVDVGVLVDVVAAVKHVIGLADECSVGRDGNDHGEGLGISLVGLGRRSDGNASHLLSEGGGVAPVQGQLVDRRRADHLLQRACRQVDLGCLGASRSPFPSSCRV